MMPPVKPYPRILHSSPAEEKKLGFPFSENGPFSIQGEGATSPFSNLREREERGVTTPSVTYKFLEFEIEEEFDGFFVYVAFVSCYYDFEELNLPIEG